MMDRAKESLAGIKSMLGDTMRKGFSAKSISEIAGAIRDIETIERYASQAKDAEPEGGAEWLIHNIEGELSAAEKYMGKWRETGDETYKAIGREELKHAETLIKLARENATEPTSTGKIQDFIVWYHALAEGLNY